MKEIKKEKTTTQTYFEYEALDGTIFNDKEECKKYENTAKCIIMTKYKSLVLISDYTQYDLFGTGNEDDHVDLLKVKSLKDIDIVVQAWLFNNTYLQEDKYKCRVNDVYDMLKKAMENDDIIFVNHGYENDNFWFEGTQHGMIDRMNALNKLVNKDTDE